MANLKTIDIKGKQYVEVNERIKYFRTAEEYKGWSLTSQIVSIENGVCIIKAKIIDDKQIIRATGYAYEKEDSTFINKTSYIENCETSAWGRALGNLGIGIDSSIASAEEVQNAQANQGNSAKPTDKQLDYLRKLLKDAGKDDVEVDNIMRMCKTASMASKWIEKAKTLAEEAS